MRITSYFTRHLQAGFNSLGNLSRSPIASLMTCLVIGIALALPTALLVALKNVQSLSSNIEDSTQITIYLKPGTNETDVRDFAQLLMKKYALKTIHTISPSTGLTELQKQTGFDGILSTLPSNPLPWVITLIPKAIDPTAVQHIAEQLNTYPLVDTAQLDIVWVKRLSNLLMLAERIFYALSLFLGIAVLLIVNNTIRSATQHHRKEIEIIKLIGGTNAFIRRPFLYAGMIYGLLGGIIAWLLVDSLLLSLRGPATQLANLYENPFHIIGLGLEETFFLLLLSTCLGLAGSWFAVSNHLRAQNKL